MSEVNISREACAAIVSGCRSAPWTVKCDDAADKIVALRAALDAAEARAVGVKPDAVDDLAKILIDAWAKAEPNHSVTKHPVSYVATFADMARAVLSTLPPASPLGAVAMRSAVLKLVDEGYDRPVSEAYRSDGIQSKHDKCAHGPWMYEDCEACLRSAIEVIPITFTPAELLAAAAELPEVRALVAVLTSIKAAWILPSADQLALEAALAPFARKGE